MATTIRLSARLSGHTASRRLEPRRLLALALVLVLALALVQVLVQELVQVGVGVSPPPGAVMTAGISS